MTQQTMLGADVVRIVANELDAADPSSARILVASTDAGRYWELLVARGGALHLRVVAGLRRSVWPPWRLDRLSYFFTPPTAAQNTIALRARIPSEDGRTAWVLVKAAQLVLTVEDVSRRLRRHVAELDPSHVAAHGVTIDRQSFSEFVANLFCLEDLLGAIQVLDLDDLALPEIALGVDVNAMSQHAVADLEQGSTDPRAIMLAARLVRPGQGYPALAEGLEPERVEHWGDTRVLDVLGAFRDAEPRDIDMATGLADVAPDARWRELNVHRLGRLAQTLARRGDPI